MAMRQRWIKNKRGAGVPEYIVILAILLGFLIFIFWKSIAGSLMLAVNSIGDNVETAGGKKASHGRSGSRHGGGSGGSSGENDPFGGSGGGYSSEYEQQRSSNTRVRF